ncbi:MAG TPA: terminase family protein [Polyangiales bacterium]|nr:terminase family protein [Polyangiales bacterium]
MNAIAELSLAEQLALDDDLRAKFFAELTDAEARALEWDWSFWARPKQIEPDGQWWRYWLVVAGRGFGKTKLGAQWITARAEADPRERIALVGETSADARDVMVEGESGLIECAPPWFKPKYEPSKRRLTWPNGARATTYSAEEPDQLRGPQHTCAWGDEIAKWRYADAFDQLAMGLRKGANPRAVFTTTPKPIPLLKELIAASQLAAKPLDKPYVYLTKGTTYENRSNLAAQFFDTVIKKYEGTRIGRQELEAEVLDDAPGALWKRDLIEDTRVHKFPELVRVAVAIDPSVSSDSASAETGIVAAGLGTDGHGYVLADGSIEQPTPEQWAKAAIALYNAHDADRIIGEVNNGGDLVESNVRSVDKRIPFKQVRASRGKQVRAEPIASFYEQKRVHHVGMFGALEDQMCQWEPGVTTWSPNRIDALVWVLTYLMLGPGVASDDDLEMPRGSGGRGWSR